MAVPTWPLGLGVILLTRESTLKHAANPSPPRQGEAIAFGLRAPSAFLGRKAVHPRPQLPAPAGTLPCCRGRGGSGELRPLNKSEQSESATAGFDCEGVHAA